MQHQKSKMLIILFQKFLKDDDDMLACQIDGPVLLLSIQNGDLEKLKMLVEKFSANVNQKIYFQGNLSTPLVFAMKCIKRYFKT